MLDSPARPRCEDLQIGCRNVTAATAEKFVPKKSHKNILTVSPLFHPRVHNYAYSENQGQLLVFGAGRTKKKIDASNFFHPK